MIVRPRSALGLKYVEITPGDVGAGLRGRRARSRCARRTPAAGRDRRGLQHVRRADARGDRSGTCAASATALAGRGADLNQAIAGAPPAAAQPRSRSMRNLSRPRTQLGALLPGARAGPPRDGRAGRRDSRPRCSRNLDTTFAALARVAAAVHPGDDRERRRRRWTPRSTSFPQQRPFLRELDRALPRAAPGRRGAAARRRRSSPTRSRPARRRCRARRAFNARLEPTSSARSQRFADRPARRRSACSA